MRRRKRKDANLKLVYLAGDTAQPERVQERRVLPQFLMAARPGAA